MPEENEDDVIDQEVAEVTDETSIEIEQPEPEEAVISLGDPPAEEEEHQRSSGLVPKLRGLVKEKSKQLIAREKELAELRAQVSGASAPKALGPEPTFEGSGYDADRFKTDLLAWNEQKRKADAAQNDAAERQKQQDAEWAQTREGYETAKAALNVPDFEVAEESVKEIFDEVQQGLILAGAENPEKMVYALGMNEAKAKELAAIKNPVKFTAALVRLELKELRVNTRPAPERTVRPSGVSANGLSSVNDRKLEELEKEAEKTGNRDKIIAFKKELKARQAQK